MIEITLWHGYFLVNLLHIFLRIPLVGCFWNIFSYPLLITAHCQLGSESSGILSKWVSPKAQPRPSMRFEMETSSKVFPHNKHCLKCARIRSFSGLNFPVTRLNIQSLREKNWIFSLRIQSPLFFCIRSRYGDLYSVRRQENADQKKLRISTLFTQSVRMRKYGPEKLQIRTFSRSVKSSLIRLTKSIV